MSTYKDCHEYVLNCPELSWNVMNRQSMSGILRNCHDSSWIIINCQKWSWRVFCLLVLAVLPTSRTLVIKCRSVLKLCSHWLCNGIVDDMFCRGPTLVMLCGIFSKNVNALRLSGQPKIMELFNFHHKIFNLNSFLTWQRHSLH